jgi:hypothetical protein
MKPTFDEYRVWVRFLRDDGLIAEAFSQNYAWAEGSGEQALDAERKSDICREEILSRMDYERSITKANKPVDKK